MGVVELAYVVWMGTLGRYYTQPIVTLNWTATRANMSLNLITAHILWMLMECQAPWSHVFFTISSEVVDNNYCYQSDTVDEERDTKENK